MTLMMTYIQNGTNVNNLRLLFYFASLLIIKRLDSNPRFQSASLFFS